ncbi:MAG TPA: L-histidine N(alpha)-methyltransferase, partial [Candidatus Saccharimonadales bacterium]|nr:L-histidine N(alpha)-methyltransferase [Candidatus Saccharimonadales bacterium]
YWDNYLQKLASTERGNILKATIDLLAQDSDQLLESIKDVRKVRIIDLGVGNGLAVEKFIQTLEATGKLETYIGVDTSKNLLDKTASNINMWTRGSISIKTYERDFTCERFHDLLAHADDTLNIVLLLGGTVGNFREPKKALQNIRESMGGDDILVATNKLDSQIARKFFDFSTKDDQSELSFHSKFMLSLLSIKEDYYRVEQFFDKERKARFIQVSLKFNVCIHFKTDSGDKSVKITKGSSILLLRMWEWSDLEMMSMLHETSFSQQRMIKTSDNEYILLVAKTETAKEWGPAT